MNLKRNYWTYSIGLAVVWAIVLIISAISNDGHRFVTVLLVFLGFTLCWISATIARYIYPPPKKWMNRD